MFEGGWNAVSQQLLSDDDRSNDLSPAAAQRLFAWQHRKREVSDQPDYNLDAGFGGPVPLIGKPLGDLRFFASFRNNREMLLVPLTREDYYDNISGKDKVGDYRKDGVAFQPIEPVGSVNGLTNPNPNVIYYDRSNGQYVSFANGSWAQVESSRMKQVLEDRAYLDMPNQSSFNEMAFFSEIQCLQRRSVEIFCT